MFDIILGMVLDKGVRAWKEIHWSKVAQWQTKFFFLRVQDVKNAWSSEKLKGVFKFFSGQYVNYKKLKGYF